jgi:glycosyltransferase involved in cell wall biosynthesis
MRDQTLHIMEIVSRRQVNGAILHCMLLSRELARRGHQVTLVCNSDSWISKEVAGEAIRVIHSDLQRWPLGELRRIAAVVRRDAVDVIHTHNSRSNFFGVLLRRMTGVPSVATAHSRHFQLHWMFNDRVIAVSEANRRFQRRINLVRADRVQTIHNFIDRERLLGVPPETRRQVRASLGVGDDELLMGAIGDVIPRKGLNHLVAALPQILAGVPRAKLLVVGDTYQTDYVEKVRTAAKRSGVERYIVWAGYRSDVPELLSALDLYVAASLEESFPLAILEAMAAGLPVVATAVGGIPECILEKQTGLLVPPGKPEPLADAILSMLGNPARRRCYGDAGRQRVLHKFSAESQVPAIERLFEQVARRRQAA